MIGLTLVVLSLFGFSCFSSVLSISKLSPNHGFQNEIVSLTYQDYLFIRQLPTDANIVNDEPFNITSSSSYIYHDKQKEKWIYKKYSADSSYAMEYTISYEYNDETKYFYYDESTEKLTNRASSPLGGASTMANGGFSIITEEQSAGLERLVEGTIYLIHLYLPDRNVYLKFDASINPDGEIEGTFVSDYSDSTQFTFNYYGDNYLSFYDNEHNLYYVTVNDSGIPAAKKSSLLTNTPISVKPKGRQTEVSTNNFTYQKLTQDNISQLFGTSNFARVIIVAKNRYAMANQVDIHYRKFEDIGEIGNTITSSYIKSLGNIVEMHMEQVIGYPNQYSFGLPYEKTQSLEYLLSSTSYKDELTSVDYVLYRSSYSPKNSDATSMRWTIDFDESGKAILKNGRNLYLRFLDNGRKNSLFSCWDEASFDSSQTNIDIYFCPGDQITVSHQEHFLGIAGSFSKAAISPSLYPIDFVFNNNDILTGKNTFAVRSTDIVSWDLEQSQAIIQAGVDLSVSSSELEIGDKLQLEYKYSPYNLSDIISFTSNNPSVATVSSDGLIAAVGAGNAIITVTFYNYFTDICEISVKAETDGEGGDEGGDTTGGDGETPEGDGGSNNDSSSDNGQTTIPPVENDEQSFLTGVIAGSAFAVVALAIPAITIPVVINKKKKAKAKKQD